MGVKTTLRALRLISAIHFAIEQESNFQPQNDMLKFPLISFYYSSFKSPFIALSKSGLISILLITCHGLLHHLLHGPETPNTKCIGKFATSVWFGNFEAPKVS